jgi:7,8-dihydropterin-6-yl-methyl-4-(beta-D-ribofuranosyl)aminobenzene 5'-phosphate synthase
MTHSPGLTVTVLVDNHTLIDRYYLAEPALSFLLESDSTKILFDTGYSDAFLCNADRMGITLLDLDCVVLSHGHLDHTGGLVPLVRRLSEAVIEGRPFRTPDLVSHPFCFYPRPTNRLPNIGSPLSLDRAQLHFHVRTSSEPLWITDRLVFLGEIPRRFAFERDSPGPREIMMPDGRRTPDLLLDDSALVFSSSEGLVIITGCSHAGICNITEYAREVCGEHRIVDILGGLHLLKPSEERMKGTCEYLRAAAPPAVHACHCTSFASLAMLSAVCPIIEVGVGLRLEYR